MTLARAEAGSQPARTAWDVVRFMYGRLAPYRWRVLGSLAIMVLRIGTGLIGPFMLLNILDEALPERDVGKLVLLCGITMAAGIATSVLGVGETALINSISQRTVSDLRLDMYDRVTAQPLEFYTAHSPSQVQTRLFSDVNGVDRFFSQTVRSGMSAVTTASTAAIVMVILCWPLALLSLLLTAALTRLNSRFAAQRRDLAKRRQEQLGTMVQHLSEDASLSGIVLRRTFGTGDGQQRRFHGVCEDIRTTTVRQRLVGAQALAFIGAAFACVPPGIFILAGVAFPGLTVGTVVVLVSLQMRLTGPLQTLLGLSSNLQASVAMFERIMEYTDLPLVRPAEAAPVGTGPSGVRMHGVSFRYGGASRAALRDVDLDFPAGSTTYVLGHTGSGKSTLSLVLTGLLAPDGGEVRAEAAAPGAPGGRSVLVPQQVTLFDGSVAENLTFLREGVTEQDMWRALETACLDETVRSLEHGLNTQLGSGGQQLSGGERQRLALARAMLLDPGMLVVDEATSALDEPTAARVHASLRSHHRDRTLVVITHRRPAPDPADRVVILEQGRVRESGTHAELCRPGTVYYGLLPEQEGPGAVASRAAARNGGRTHDFVPFDKP